MISGVDVVQIPSRTQAAAREFYEHVLGLRPSLVYQRGDTPAVGAEFENGTVTLALVDCPALGMEFRPNATAIAFKVDDFEAARADLEAKGVELRDTIDSGACLMGIFHDPDGNLLMLHHRYTPR